MKGRKKRWLFCVFLFDNAIHQLYSGYKKNDYKCTCTCIFVDISSSSQNVFGSSQRLVKLFLKALLVR